MPGSQGNATLTPVSAGSAWIQAVNESELRSWQEF